MSIPLVHHVVVSLAAGGLERLVVDWTNARNARAPGSTRVICLDEPGALAPLVESGAVTVLRAVRARFPWDREAVRALADAVGPRAGAAAPALLHAHNLAAWQYAVLASRAARVPVVYTQHGANPHTHGFVNRVRIRTLLPFTRRIVAVSEATAEAMGRHHGIARGQIEVIPNGIAPLAPLDEPARRALCAGLGLGADDLVIGSVGRLAAVKGYDRLIRCFGAVAGAPGPSPLRLLLVGDGPDRPALERLAASCGAGGKVIFAGLQLEARRYLELMALFVLPSRSEGLPVALLEAMAAGVPAAATDAGESRTVLEDGAAGTILPDDEARWPDMLSGLLAALRRGGLRGAVERARARVESRYSLARTLELYERTYAGEPCS